MRRIAHVIIAAACAACFGPVMAQTAATDADNAVWYNARRGDPAAMNQVGIWYYSGQKVAKDYDKAYEWWSRGALAGNPKAIANLGVCYQYGRGVKADSVSAMQLYVKAIEMGQEQLFEQRSKNTPGSLFDDMLIATCYERGIGTKADPARAAELYAHVAERGSLDAVKAAARAYAAAGDRDKAQHYYDNAAQLGDTESMYLSARQRIDRLTDMDNAVSTLRKAAQAGVPGAQALLGQCYLSGNGVPADADVAAQWLRRAACAGDAAAMWQYAELMRREQDYDEAMHWMAQAVAAGATDDFVVLVRTLGPTDPYVQYLRGMKAYVIDNDPAKAADCFKGAARNKIESAVVMEAVAMADPANNQSNASKAAKTLDKMADDNLMAAYCLAGLYAGGHGVDRSASRAIRLYRQAADAGYAPAQNALADIYYAGEITAADRPAAARLYQKAYDARALGRDGAERMQSVYTGGAYGVAADAAKAAAMAHYMGWQALPAMLSLVE